MNQNQGQRQWTPIAGGQQALNQRWKPQDNLNYNPNDPANFIQGYFKDLLERTSSTPQGVKTFLVAEIVMVNPDGTLGETIDVSGGKVLTGMLENITMGAFIGIKYCGKERSKSSGFTFNNWEVYEDKNAIPFQQLGGHLKQKQSYAPTPPTPAAPVWQNQGAPIPQGSTAPSAPNFNSAATPPAYAPPAPAFNPAPPVPQRPYVPPAGNQAYTPPTPPAQAYNSAAPQGTPPPTFGGQPIPPGAYGNHAEEDLPF